ncbi:uncharacterized protein MONBRDRAFT_25815 [Monosiga brevicollis MX1]|uniref:Glycosyl transferase family 1 domain-containing protein n=1 Tax=Monosiga brevicollis TaxID=81824 RepID=A9V0I4_MONBE|nr:uncharacterized protein MONBRDRAFT_25815 [Monosiga brevicollis MX1]EDQ89020.1 predicted protein [Monosiga brevicollis MX1]|eukprot:XP_001746125.1 hypothetical protein [Monosiga brevicollis MX1]
MAGRRGWVSLFVVGLHLLAWSWVWTGISRSDDLAKAPWPVIASGPSIPGTPGAVSSAALTTVEPQPEANSALSQSTTLLPPLGFTVHWFAPFASPSGYGSEARAYIAALRQVSRLQLRISQHGDTPDPEFVASLDSEQERELAALARTTSDPDETVVVCHSEPGAWNPPRYETSLCPPAEEPLYVVGRTMFETDRVPYEWIERCRTMDEIWVPTAFHVETFARAGMDRARLRVVPEAVDTARFSPGGPALALPLTAPLLIDQPCGVSGLGPAQPAPLHTRFLSVFKWEPRKGWPLLLRAFTRAFAGSCRASLHIVTSRFHSSADLNELAQTHVRAALVEYLQERGRRVTSAQIRALWPSLFVSQRFVPDGEMPQLYRAADVFVLPSHGEGFGRPHVEAMASGLPVMATNWSGPTAYMTRDNGYPIPIEGLVPLPDGPFRGRHQWAMPNVTALEALLLEAADNAEARRQKGVLARQAADVMYSPARVGRLVYSELRRIEARLRRDGDLA